MVIACLYGLRDARDDPGLARALFPGVGPLLQAGRALRRRPGYSLTVVTLVAVAAGSIGCLAGVARAIGAPGDPDLGPVRVVVGTDTERGWSSAYLSVPEIEDLKRSVSGLDDVGVFLTDATVGLDRDGAVEAVSANFAEAAYFSALHARTQLGRTFTEAEG